jgi:predicted nuclease of predicted toxin-antitoxin system
MRRHGFDAVSARELQMLRASDEQHLQHAINEQRAIVTADRDFMQLHSACLLAGREHWGIIFTNEQDTGVIMHQLLRLLNTLTITDLQNQFRWLNDFR